MKNYKNMWNEILNEKELPIADIVALMTQECPPYKGGERYETIAHRWLTEMSLHAYALSHFDSREGYQISTSKLRDKFTYRYARTNYWFKWFDKNYPIWTVLPGMKGNNIKGNTRAMIHPDKDLLVASLDPDQVADAFVDEYPDNCRLDFIDINVKELQQYIKRTKVDLHNHAGRRDDNYSKKLKRSITDATLLVKLALGVNEEIVCTQTGEFRYRIPQPYRISPFGRKYYLTSYALQNKSSKVRSAALGRCWGVDIDSSVFRFYKMLAESCDIEHATLDLLLKDKVAFREELATTLQNIKYEKVTLVKAAITSMGFGARDTSYWDPVAQKQKGALQGIIKNKEDRDRLTEHPLWIDLKRIYNEIKQKVCGDRSIVDPYKNDPQYWTKNAYTRDRLMSLLYQQYESKVIDRTWELLEQHGRVPKLLVHDGLYTLLNPNRDRLFVDGILPVLQAELNPHLKFDIEENGLWYNKVDHDHVDAQKDLHQQRMAEQERIAQQKYHNTEKETPAELTRRLKMQNAFNEPHESYEERHSYFYED